MMSEEKSEGWMWGGSMIGLTRPRLPREALDICMVCRGVGRGNTKCCVFLFFLFFLALGSWSFLEDESRGTIRLNSDVVWGPGLL